MAFSVVINWETCLQVKTAIIEKFTVNCRDLTFLHTEVQLHVKSMSPVQGDLRVVKRTARTRAHDP